MSPRNSRALDPRRAVAYLRVSTEEQKNGPEAQRAAIEMWAAAHGVEVVAWFEEHVSGGAPLKKRLELLGGINALRELGAGVLVAAKRDRIARDTMLATLIVRQVEALGAHLVTADGVPGDDTPEARLIRGILDLFAEYERALIRARTRAGLQAKRKRGEYTGGSAPYGWRLNGDGRLHEDAGEQRILRRIEEWRAEGIGVPTIARRLNQAGTPARGGAWHVKTVQRVLTR